MHVLFHLEIPQTVSEKISEKALLAALDFVELRNQHAAFLAGKGLIEDEIEALIYKSFVIQNKEYEWKRSYIMIKVKTDISAVKIIYEDISS